MKSELAGVFANRDVLVNQVCAIPLVGLHLDRTCASNGRPRLLAYA
jgi:hypothetical protein